MRCMMLVRSVAPAAPMEVKVDLGCETGNIMLELGTALLSSTRVTDKPEV